MFTCKYILKEIMNFFKDKMSNLFNSVFRCSDIFFFVSTATCTEENDKWRLFVESGK